MTPVDSLYEYGGFRMAEIFSDLAWSVGFPLILALAGLAYVVHACMERGSMRDAAVHVFYLLLVAWLLGPTKVVVRGGPGDLRERLDLKSPTDGAAKAPRFIAFLGSAADYIQKKAIAKIDERFLNEPFERERLAAALDAADIFDGELKGDLRQFGRQCYRVAVAGDKRPSEELARLDPLAPDSFDYRAGEARVSDRLVSCAVARGELRGRVDDHLTNHGFHGMVRGLLRDFDLLDEKRTAEYRGAVVRRAMLGPREWQGESLLVAASLPSPSEVERYHRSEKMTEAADAGWLNDIPVPGGVSVGEVMDFVGELFFDTTSRAKQIVDNQYTMKQKTYIAITQGPYLYGLAVMIVLGLFPVVGLAALLPGRWRALMNYGKIFLSIKLWPVCWAILSRFNARARGLDVFGDNIGTGDFVLVLSSMYLLTPVLCFGFVSLDT